MATQDNNVPWGQGGRSKMSERIDNGFLNTDQHYALRDKDGNTCCEHCGIVLELESRISTGGEVLTVCGNCFDELREQYP